MSVVPRRDDAPAAETAGQETARADVVSEVGAGRARRALFAGAFGNFVEWYDYSVYGFVATVIAAEFFPSTNTVTSLLAAFAAFGLTFAARPVGALVFGHFGDRVGRRNTLAASVLLMAFASLVIGVLPTYADIGVWAPVLLVIARLVQGFSAGGETGGSSSFLVEHAPRGRRGLYGSWQQFGIVSGLLLGSLFGAMLGEALSTEQMASWGWRLPFLLGAVLGLFGLYLRLRLDETPVFREFEQNRPVERAPVKGAVTTHRRAVVNGVGFFIAPTVSSYVLLVFMPTYAQKTLGLSFAETLLSNAIALAVLAALIPFVGVLSDRVGRRPLMLVFAASLAVCTFPLFLLISQASFAALLVGQLAFSVLTVFYYGPGTAMYVELFPTSVRYTGIGISLGVSAALFGGTAPFISTWLISWTGNTMAPAFYLIAAALVSLVVVSRLPETAYTALEHA